MMKKLFGILIFASVRVSLYSQCVIFCNQNVGLYSTDNARTIGYDNISSSFHSSVATEPTGFIVWGENMAANGTGHNLAPLMMNSTNYSALTGSVYYVGVGSSSIYAVQLIVLTSTGLFASGTPGVVLSTAIKNTSAFQKLAINGKMDGLPPGVTPDSVKMMFVTYKSIIITTCGGSVFSLSQTANMRGGGGTGSSTQWTQVMQNGSTPLTNVIVARGGSDFGFALKADSTIWTWGNNVLLGNATSTFNSNIAVQMVTPSGCPGIKMIQGTRQGSTSTNFPSYYILGTDQNVYSLGMNNYGQLGDNTSTDRFVWVNALNPNSTTINNAVWISANEHDTEYANLGILKTNGQAYTCGNNNNSMIGRTVNSGFNNLNFPVGISATDTITYIEVGGHTTAFTKKNTIRYGYVGHYINGSIGSGVNSSSTLSSVNFILPPVINVCGTNCDTPKILKRPFTCGDTIVVFTIKSKVNTKILYNINNGNIDSVTIGVADSVDIIVRNPTKNTTINIVKVANISCNLPVNTKDSILGYFSSVNNQTICSNQSYIWNGMNRNTTGSYLDTFQTSLGCDSIVTLNLVVNPTKSSSITVTICSNESYSWNGIHRNTSGSYLDTFQTSLGCDSIVTLNLVVNPAKSTSFSASICSGQSYNWNGMNRNTTGAYLDTFQTSLGCDSVVTLNLTVNPSKSSSFSVSICSDQSYLWNGLSLNTTGDYLDTFQTSLGCDSIVTLNLVVNTKYINAMTVQQCGGTTFYWNGTPYNTSGVLRDTFLSINGCDSIVIITLNFNPILLSDIVMIDSLLCYGDAIASLKTNVSGGTSPYFYTWSNMKTTDKIANLKSGRYAVTVKDLYDCVSSDTFVVKQPDSISGVVITKDATCFGGSDGTITVIMKTGKAPYRYAWSISNHPDTNFAQNLRSNLYAVSVSDNNGCKIVLSDSVRQPSMVDATFRFFEPSCTQNVDGMIIAKPFGGKAPYTLVWTVTPPIVSDTIQNIGSDYYTLSIEDAVGCQVRKTVFLIEPEKQFYVKLLDYKNLTCYQSNDGVLSVNGDGGRTPYRFNWNINSIDSTKNKISNLKANTRYAVKIVDKNGCADTASYVLKEPFPLKVKIKTIGHNVCPNQKIGYFSLETSGGTPSYRYSIDSFKTYHRVPEFQYLEAGKYLVKVLDSNQCRDSIPVSIQGVEEVFLNVTPAIDTIDMCSSIQLNSIVWTKSGILPSDMVYRWTEPSGLSCVDCIDPIVHSYVSHIYPLVITFNKGQCKVQAASNILVRGAQAIYIPNSFSPNNDGVNDSFEVYGNCIREKDMSIYNRWGEKIYASKLPQNGWDGNYRGSPSPIGVYSYIVFVTFLNNEIKKFTGEFMLYR